MATSASERVKRAYDACVPRSVTGQLLLDQYLQRVDLDRPGPTAENEVVVFHELCRLVADVDLSTISHIWLLGWAQAEGLSVTARKRRRLVVGRLLRMLEQDGFPVASERTAKLRVAKALESLQPEQAARLHRWVKLRRGQNVGWYHLSHETRHLAVLERCASDRDGLDSAALIRDWLAQIVRQVVDCDCPPVTRHPDPTRCKSCGATFETHGHRPAPGPRKQDELAAIGRRYLTARAGLEASS